MNHEQIQEHNPVHIKCVLYPRGKISDNTTWLQRKVLPPLYRWRGK